jgi:hypothetical protein
VKEPAGWGSLPGLDKIVIVVAGWKLKPSKGCRARTPFFAPKVQCKETKKDTSLLSLSVC